MENCYDAYVTKTSAVTQTDNLYTKTSFSTHVSSSVDVKGTSGFGVSPAFASHFQDEAVTASKMNALLEEAQVLSLPDGVQMMDFIGQNRLTMANGSPFHVMDLRIVEQRWAKWRHFMPRVDPFYAMKCNTDPMLLRTLFAHGAGFDCASKAEIELALKLGCPAQRIIFANPTKLVSDLEYAATNGVTRMTFDNEDELFKIAAAYQKFPGVIPQPVVRIVTDDSNSVCKFSLKYGASLDDVEHLLTVAAELGLPIIGCSFHVGSGCGSVFSFLKAIRDARRVFDTGLKLGHPMHLLDLGGGYPGDDQGRIAIPTISHYVTPLLDELFPAPQLGDDPCVAALTGVEIPPVHIIAEPGRYFAHASMHFSTPIIARRLNSKLPSWTTKNGQANREPHVLYYIGDGVYGAFNCILYDHYTPDIPRAYFADSERQRMYDELTLKAAPRALHSAYRISDSTTSDSDNESDAVSAGSDAVNADSAGADSDLPPGTVRAKVFGPTCDGLDTIFQEVPLPLMDVGEWLVFPNMGAYTVAAQSSFNGIPRPSVIYARSSTSIHDYDFDALAARMAAATAEVAVKDEAVASTMANAADDIDVNLALNVSSMTLEERDSLSPSPVHSDHGLDGFLSPTSP